ncbi:MAG TPA: phage baseplate assembly protein V [Rhizomicrobium sp.]|jgi:uncharacterized protein involved in type VI secretion and phage assembly|nr:phage baseplate assembly protein V [Rhizomicrobium sp.]
MTGSDKLWGKYRGMVMNNIDPMQLGRLMVQVPDATGLLPSTWAMPCLPMAGKQSGIWALPQVGSGVWVEFEQGDIDYPIWTGCWYGTAAEVPSLALAAIPGQPNIVLQTGGQTTLMLSDTPGPTGGILLKTSSGASIMINDIGITITNGKGATISLTGPTVTINESALSVT